MHPQQANHDEARPLAFGAPLQSQRHALTHALFPSASIQKLEGLAAGGGHASLFGIRCLETQDPFSLLHCTHLVLDESAEWLPLLLTGVPCEEAALQGSSRACSCALQHGLPAEDAPGQVQRSAGQQRPAGGMCSQP